MPQTANQRRAIALAIARKKKKQSSYVYGHGSYHKRKPVVYRAPRAERVERSEGSSGYKSSIGARIGSTIGGIVGYGAQQLVKHITGFGDYNITSNSLMGGLYDPPEIQNLKSRCTVVRHREYIQDIVASSAFSNLQFDINPGLSSSFPWMSQVAGAFEEYYISGMIFEFKTLSADYTTASSAAMGYVIMATQYNSLNPAFSDKITMENYEFANSSKPSQTFIHPIECKKSVNPVSELYVRTGAVPLTGDQRLYDLGVFQIATGGNSGSGILGELWVTFEVLLCKPKLIQDEVFIASDKYVLPFALIANTAPFGVTTNGQVPDANSNIGTAINSFGTIIYWPETVQSGVYLVEIIWTGASTACTAPTLTGVRCTFPTMFRNNVASNVSNTATTVTQFFYTFYVNVTGPAPNVTLGIAGTLPGTLSSADLIITQWNSAVL